MKKNHSDERRTFLRKSLGVAGGVALAATLPVLSGCEEETYKNPTGPIIPPSNEVTLDVSTSEYVVLAASGGLIDIDVQHNGATLKLMVFRVDTAKAVTLTRKCTHKGCDLATKFSGELIDGDTIQCDCHSSRFNMISGAVEKGPATDDLATYETTIDGNIITIKLA